MKKLLTLAALLGTASVSFGQGAVSFANSVSSLTHISTAGPSGTNRISGAIGSYYFALFYGPSTNQLTSLDPTLSGFTYLAPGTNTTALGRFTGNATTDGIVVPGYAVGTTAGLVVVGWDASLGNSWSNAAAWWNNGNATTAFGGPTSAYIGRSGLAEIGLGGGLNPILTVLGTGAGQALGFNLNLTIAPEPSTFALAGLGAASLLIFRRRK